MKKLLLALFAVTLALSSTPAMAEGTRVDEVAAFHDAEGAAERGLGGDVADVEAVAAAGEAAVGDERDILDEAAAGDGAGG